MRTFSERSFLVLCILGSPLDRAGRENGGHNDRHWNFARRLESLF
jgi:hypothetical protein